MLASSDYEGTVTLWDAFAGTHTRLFQVLLRVFVTHFHSFFLGQPTLCIFIVYRYISHVTIELEELQGITCW